jgi:hypothetical protein
VWKKSAATKSAADRQVVGCPEPAKVVISTQWRRSSCAIAANASTFCRSVITPASFTSDVFAVSLQCDAF